MYCYLLKHIMVGDVKVPLFCTVHRKSNVRQREDAIEHVFFNPVQYVPVEKELRYECHPTVDQLLGIVTVHRQQGICGVEVLLDDAPLSFITEGRSPFECSMVTLC